MLPFLQKPLVGLDIGTSSVKMVLLSGNAKKGYTLENMGIVPVPSETIVDGALMNSAAIVDCILGLSQELKVKAKEVATSISGNSVIIRKIQLPEMSESELSDSIQWEAEQYIPFDINDVNIDFQILSEEVNDEGQMDVLLVAAKKDMINDYVGVITEAGFTTAVMDVDAFAVQNMFEVNYEINPEETVALVNMGASVCNINVLQGNISAFTRDVTSGGEQYTEEIQKGLGISYEEAEIMKRGGDAEGEEGVMPQGVASILQSVSDSLAGEIQRSLDFYTATSSEARISKVYLCGGTSVTPGLATAIADRSGYPVEIVNPFNNIAVNEKVLDVTEVAKAAPQLAVGVGLALRKP